MKRTILAALTMALALSASTGYAHAHADPLSSTRIVVIHKGTSVGPTTAVVQVVTLPSEVVQRIESERLQWVDSDVEVASDAQALPDLRLSAAPVRVLSACGVEPAASPPLQRAAPKLPDDQALLTACAFNPFEAWRARCKPILRSVLGTARIPNLSLRGSTPRRRAVPV
jgi:hypothetical protein